jgi:hypothetical protein
MNFTRLLAVACVAMFIGGALPAVAGATDYCVDTSCGGTEATSLDQALDLADDSDDADRVFLGAKVYTPQGPTFAYVGFGPVEIIGQGSGRTILTGGSKSVLRLLAGSGSSVHDLTVRLPQNAATSMSGVETNSLVRRVSIVEDPMQVNHNRYGVRLAGGGTLADSTVQLGSDQETTAAALGSRVGVADGGNTIRDSTLSAETGVETVHGATIERSRVTGLHYGIRNYGDLTTVRNSVVRITGPYGTGIRADVQPSLDSAIAADGLTVIVPDDPDVGGVEATTSTAPDHSTHVTLSNSIIRGGPWPLIALAGGGGTATISASYSDYDPSGNVAWGNAKIDEANISNVGDAGFDPRSGHDYELLPTSALLDKGDPTAAQALDLAGNARVADGNGDGIARRDIGAFELQPAGAGAPSGDGPMGGPGADTQAPLISGFRSTRLVFAVASAATPTAAGTKRGTTLRYTLSENARVVIRIKRKTGRRYRTVGTLRRNALTGSNRVRFSGRIGRRALKAGRYRAVLIATDGAANRSAPKRAGFRIVR